MVTKLWNKTKKSSIIKKVLKLKSSAIKKVLKLKKVPKQLKSGKTGTVLWNFFVTFCFKPADNSLRNHAVCPWHLPELPHAADRPRGNDPVAAS